MHVGNLAPPAVTLAEAQAYVRVETGEEEAILAGLVRTATAMCEQFTGRVLLLREYTETLRASGDWQRLGLTPVRSVDTVEAIGEDGATTVLPAGAWTYRKLVDEGARPMISVRRGCRLSLQPDRGRRPWPSP
jgi:uncharacterized phiE125 gp8 family phage protein